MNKIQICGTQKFMGIEIPIVEGGFGENQKVILASTVAEIHEVRLNDIQDLIKQNIVEFELGIDLLDLCDENFKTDAVGLGFITSNRQKNCYLLSEQGYMLLVGFMKTEKARKIRKKLRRDYFSMRKIINSGEQLKAKLLLSIYDGGQTAVLASKQLSELEVKEATAPLIAENEEMKPKAAFHDAIQVSKNCISFGEFSAALQNNKELKSVKLGRNTVMEWCRSQGYLCTSYDLKNKPSQQMLTCGYMEYKENVTERNGKNHITYKPLLSGKGQIWLTKKLIEYYGEAA